MIEKEVGKQKEPMREMHDDEVIEVEENVKHDGEVGEEHKREQGQPHVELSNKRYKGSLSPWNFGNFK